MVRYNPDRNLDNAFGAEGKARTDFGGSEHGNALIRQPDGKLVAVGSSDDAFALERYLGGQQNYLIWMTGVGLASNTDIPGRAKEFEKKISEDTQVAVFSPSAHRGYTDSDIKIVLDALDSLKQSEVPGISLHFLVSSAAAGPFENNIYQHLPSEIGAIFMAQPFCVPLSNIALPTNPPCNTQTMLPNIVEPLLYVIYDIEMDLDLQ